MRRFAKLAAVLTLLAATALLSPTYSVVEAQTSCPVATQNLFVRDALNEFYLWYRELPSISPLSFDSPEAYLEAVRYRPRDSTFSYISSRAEDSAFFSDSQFIGVGLSMKVENDAVRLTQVYPDGPAAEVGLQRGSVLLEIAGRTTAELIASGELSDAFGAAEIGVAVDIVFRNGQEEPRSATLTKRLVTIPTVSQTRILDVDGRKIGYVFFRNFVQPSVVALDAAFSTLLAAGASDLILDLRYNGGGLVSVAQHLGGLIGGALTEGQIFSSYVHNDRNSFRDRDIRFEGKPNALTLNRLIVITTRGSASASELIINALRPFMPVIVVGETTFGKPVGQFSFNFCEKVLHPVSFTLRNANNEGDFYDGFAPDCSAADDLDHGLGDGDEASLAEAVHFARSGGCKTAATAARVLPQCTAPRLRESGWRQLVGAY